MMIFGSKVPPDREIAELWSAGTSLIYLVTNEEDRAITYCQGAAQSFDAPCAVWSMHHGIEPLAPDARHPLKALDAIAQAPAPLLVTLLDFHEQLADPAVARRLRDLLPKFTAEGRCLVIVAPRFALPEGLATEAAVIRLPLPGEDELGVLLAELAPETKKLHAEATHRARLAARGLTLSQARRALLRALRVDAALGPAAVAVILGEKKRILAHDLGLEHIEVAESMDDLGGLESFKVWLAERAQAFAPDAHKFGLEAPKGVMLLGVQGCGKSLSAKCVASQLGVPLLRLDLPRVLGGGAGPAEENLARALTAAEAVAPVALWVDEIEKGFAGSGPGQGGDSRASRILGAFSTWLQERQSGVFVVATANDVAKLPPELMRRGRFDELFFVDLPDVEARRAILSLHLRKRARDPKDFDLSSLAQHCANYSGAELEQVVVGALHRAFALKRALEAADLRRVAQDLVPLFKTYEEEIKGLREWARGRARVAGREGAVIDLFRLVSNDRG